MTLLAILTFTGHVRHAQLFQFLQLFLLVVRSDGGLEQLRPAVLARAEEADGEVRQGGRPVRRGGQRGQDDEGVR